MNVLTKICLILALFLSIHTHGQGNQTYWNYDISHGLPTNNLYHLLIDHSGKIWFGSDYGVICYDGNEFKTYTVEDGLMDNTVIRCYEDSLNRIWFQHVSQPPTYFFKGKIHRLGNNVIDFQVSTTSFLVEFKKGEIVAYGQDKDLEGYLIADPNTTSRFVKCKNGECGQTIASTKGILYIISTSFLSENISLNGSKLMNCPIYHWQEYSKMGIDVQGVLRSFKDIDRSILELSGKFAFKKIYHVVKHENDCYFATSNGLFKFRKLGNAWLFQSHQLEGKIIVSCGIDSEKNVWATSLNSGLYFIPHAKYSTIQLSENERCVFTYENDGKIYTGGENMYISEIKNGKIQKTNIPESHEIVFNKQQYSLGLIVHSDLRIYTEALLWQIYNTQNKTINKIKIGKIGNGFAHAQLSTKKDKLYFFGQQGIGYSTMDVGAEHIIISKTIGRIKSISDRNGILFIASQKGLYSDINGKIELFNKKIFGESRINSVQEIQELLFIGTSDKGIWIYNTRTKKLSQVIKNVLSKTIKGIYVGKNNTIWVHTNIGLQHFSVVSETLKELKRIDLKTVLKVNDIVNLHEINDTLIIATNKVFYFLPTNQSFVPKKITLSLSNVFVNSTLRKLSSLSALKPSQNNIVFEFNSVSRSSFKSSFFYRINKGKWIENVGSTFSFYSLPAGKYKIDFKAESPFYTSNYVNNIVFNIQKKWWETPISIFLGFFLSILLVALFVRWRITKTQETKRRSLSNELFSLEDIV